MYQCSECNKKFNTKPDFCVCGNDKFIETDEHAETSSLQNKQEQQLEPQTNDNKSILSNSPKLQQTIKSLDKLSLTVFWVCIFLSILVILFLGNKNSHPEIMLNDDVKNAVEKEVKADLPEIDELWE